MGQMEMPYRFDSYERCSANQLLGLILRVAATVSALSPPPTMAPSSSTKPPTQSYKYILNSAGQPKILPVDDFSCKDEESPAEYNTGGYCPVKLNDTFKLGRYRVLRKLGWGHFSTVWLVKDTELNRHSALKVVKSAGRYAETARDEIKLLSRVASVSPLHPGRQHIVSFLDSFAHQGPEASHICIVFEPLGEHLLSLIERNKRKGVPRALVKVIAKQVLLGLEYLHDECDLVHTDIKPENILISIPDVEAHIYNELTHSPSPTSRRVGVPPPTKSRPSVSIPQTQRSRRQVQIFDSQPLGSPGSRSGGPLSSLSGPNSVSGSYVSPVQMSHMAKYGTNGLSTSAPKVPSGLSASSPRTVVPSSKSNPVTAASSQANSPTSTASSSSSVSSTPFTAAGSVGTPPTSLSNSFGSAMAAIVHATQESEKRVSTAPQPIPNQLQERVGVPMKGKKQTVIECELENALSTSWKDKIGLSRETPISVSHKSTNSISGKSKILHGHTRSSSGISVSSSWKDPGLSAPAPALVVSAVVSADGDQQGDYFHLAGTSASLTESGSVTTTSSESSTATVTKARPSPNGTPLASAAKKSNGFKIETTGVPEPEASTCSNEPKSVIPSNPNPSLLSQTAPPRIVSNPTAKNTPLRVSAPLHASQISSHSQLPPSPPSGSLNTDDHNNNSRPAAAPFTYVPILRSISHADGSEPSPVGESYARADTCPVGRRRAPSAPAHARPRAAQAAPVVCTRDQHQDRRLGQRDAVQEALHRGHPDAAVPLARGDHWAEGLGHKGGYMERGVFGEFRFHSVFELLTAEFLFDPQGQGDLFSKDDDHMAQIIELLGDFTLDVKMGGKYSQDLFDANGALRFIKTLKPWPLKRVMMEKYLWSEPDAAVLCTFLGPMLAIDPRNRTDAKDMLDHPWLEVTAADDVVGDW
ncbi:Protein kinase dsk1 [Mycena venus]|uniref:non-specific serine/threonine protein kinase n=1 Tax=Mycena venus TaxID=2733690 RepID=A0A8H7CKZ8_9AGAR|nr:Protein kinase dsk1 [Mycena venus]